MFKCEYCEKEFKVKRGLKNHIDKFYPETVTYNFKCEVCQKGFDELPRLLTHISKVHKEVNLKEYYNQNLYGKIKCKYCGDILPFERYSGEFCNQQHYESFNRKDEIKFKCKFCNTGFKDKGGLQQHLGKMHKEVNQEEYYRKHLMSNDEPNGKCLWCGEEVNFSSFTDGYNKFCYNTDCNVRYYNENTDRKKVAAKSLSNTYKNDKSLLPQNKEYWIKKGYSEKEAKQKVKERQTTFSKEICIEKYGEEEGLKKFKERQYKWINNFPKQNYSMVSQELFWEIYKDIKNKFDDIYFATIENGEKCENKNKEYRLKTENTTRSLDFYIHKINKCIEFDGTYWHGEEGKGNKLRDKLRDDEIIKCGIEVFHVKEKDYKDEPSKVIKECLEFLNG